MSRYDDLKNRYPRLKNTMFYLVVIIIGISTIFIITVLTNHYTSSAKIINNNSELIDSVIEQEKKIDIDIDIDYLLKYEGNTLNDKDSLHKLVSELALGEEIDNISYSDQNNKYGIELEYDISNYHSLIEDFTISHKLLINSVIIMGLYEDINVTKFTITQDGNTIKKLFYRQDLEEYLTSHLNQNDKQSNTQIKQLLSIKNINFNDNIAYFIDVDNAIEYISNTYHDISELGTDVDYFYAANFSLYTQANRELPYMDEDMGEELLKEYGAKLFIEGLKHTNEYVKYYSVYRLLEFYGYENLEEIVLELTICEQTCKDSRVKEACEYVRNIFANISTNQNMFITRYSENEYEGGKNIYFLDDGKISLWGKFDTPTNVIGELTPKYGMETGSKILIDGQSQDGRFVYILPIKVEELYMINNTMAKAGDEVHSNIVKLLEEEVGNTTEHSNLDKVNIELKWYEESCISIVLKEYDKEIIYNFIEDKFVIYTDDKREMKVEQFLCELSHEFSFYGEQIIDKDDVINKEEKMIVSTSTKARQIFLEEINDSLQNSGIDRVNVYTNGAIDIDELEELERRYEISENELLSSNQIKDRANIYYNKNFIITYRGDNNGVKDCIENILY